MSLSLLTFAASSLVMGAMANPSSMTASHCEQLWAVNATALMPNAGNFIGDVNSAGDPGEGTGGTITAGLTYDSWTDVNSQFYTFWSTAKDGFQTAIRVRGETQSYCDPDWTGAAVDCPIITWCDPLTDDHACQAYIEQGNAGGDFELVSGLTNCGYHLVDTNVYFNIYHRAAAEITVDVIYAASATEMYLQTFTAVNDYVDEGPQDYSGSYYSPSSYYVSSASTIMLSGAAASAAAIVGWLNY